MIAREPGSAMVVNILAAYDRASTDQLAGGRDWYPRAGRIIADIAQWSGVDPATIAAIVAALSPRNPWQWNVQDAASYAYAAAHGQSQPIGATTFSSNAARAWAFATGTSDWQGSALKVRSFVSNMTGDWHAVTVDVWAVRVATGNARDSVKSDADYAAIATAYREAAMATGETPRDLQAITWLVAQASMPANGRHARTIKRGTLPIVNFLLTGQLALFGM